MRPLSATDAINPAIARTKAILFQPFQWGRSWKLAATAYLSAMVSIFIPTPALTLGSLGSHPKSLPLVLFSVGFNIIASLVLFVFFYIGARLEFVLFDIVLLREQFVAPSWRRHASHTWRWVGLKLIVSLFFALIISPAFVFAFRNLQANTPTPGEPPSPHFIGSLLVFYAIIGLPLMFATLCSSLLTNFVLPSIAIENTTAREGLRRFLGLLRAEPGPVSLYVVLKIALAIVAVMVLQVAVLLAEIAAFVILGIIALLGWLLFRSVGDAGHVALIAGGIFLLVVFMIVAMYFATLALGAFHVFFQAYALYFLGGRYPMLGDLLEPPAQVYPYAPPPPAPPPAFQPITPPPPEPAL